MRKQTIVWFTKNNSHQIAVITPSYSTHASAEARYHLVNLLRDDADKKIKILRVFELDLDPDETTYTTLTP